MRKPILISIVFLLYGGVLTEAQSFSDKDMKPYVDLWNDEQTDSLKQLLPVLLKKFPSRPEIQFLVAVFEPDGDRAYTLFGNLVTQYPKGYFAPESLFRQIQYDVAKGRYQVAQSNLGILRQKYAGSKFIMPSEAFFSGLKTDSIKVASTAKEETQAASELPKKFHLQVGAFSTEKNATELRDKLAPKGYKPIEFSEKTVNDKKLILVWVGAYATREEAQKAGELLKQKESLPFSIVEK